MNRFEKRKRDIDAELLKLSAKDWILPLSVAALAVVCGLGLSYLGRLI